MGEAVFPGTAFLELARAAYAAEAPGRPVVMTDIYFLAPLVIEEIRTKEVRTILKQRDGGFEFVIVSRMRAHADEWHEHARGHIAALTLAPPTPRDVCELARRCAGEDIDVAGGDSHRLAERFNAFTPHWHNVERLQLGAGEGLATLQLAPQFAAEAETFLLHPALADMATGFMSVVEGFESG